MAKKKPGPNTDSALAIAPDSTQGAVVLDGSVALDGSFYMPPKTLRITCTHDGFRRGGRAWSQTPTVVMSGEFTAVQLAQIMAEPRLTVEIVGGEGTPA